MKTDYDLFLEMFEMKDSLELIDYEDYFINRVLVAVRNNETEKIIDEFEDYTNQADELEKKFNIRRKRKISDFFIILYDILLNCEDKAEEKLEKLRKKLKGGLENGY